MQRRTREKREEFTKARKEAEKTCGKKNRIFFNEQVHLIEKQFKNLNNKEAYKYVKRFRGGYKSCTHLCRERKGQIIGETTIIRHRRTISQKLLGQHENETVQHGGKQDDNNNITSQQEEIIDKLQNSYLIDPSSLEEINKAIKILKNNKAPGFDKVSLQNCTSWKSRVKT